MKYYHIHRGIKPSTIENPIEGKPLFFSRKDSFWYNVEKHVSKSYGGYIIYEVDIPAKLFTTSFHPKKSKVVRITPDNKYEYVKLSRKPNFIAEMTTRNIIGIDATNIFLKHAEASPPEGYIWSFKNIKIKKIEVIKL